MQHSFGPVTAGEGWRRKLKDYAASQSANAASVAPGICSAVQIPRSIERQTGKGPYALYREGKAEKSSFRPRPAGQSRRANLENRSCVIERVIKSRTRCRAIKIPRMIKNQGSPRSARIAAVLNVVKNALRPAAARHSRRRERKCHAAADDNRQYSARPIAPINGGAIEIARRVNGQSRRRLSPICTVEVVQNGLRPRGGRRHRRAYLVDNAQIIGPASPGCAIKIARQVGDQITLRTSAGGCAVEMEDGSFGLRRCCVCE